MKVLATPEQESLNQTDDSIIQMPFGLLGFESLKRFVLLANPEEAPFLWFESPDDPSISFLVVSPFTVLPNYQPELTPEDVALLELKNPRDAMIFNIVTLRGHHAPTVNLKGPIVVNRATLVGKQVIPVNAANYAVQHPLVAPETAS
jgi:flagellar assembly factor FliW